MAVIQFSHANGIPAGTYRYLLDQLAPHQVHAVPVFGLGDAHPQRNWAPLVRELITAIEAHGQGPVVGIGHSLGAVLSLRAAMARPELFSSLILMDPPLFGRSKRLMIGLVRALGVAGRTIPPARLARRRRTHFDSLAQARDYWGQRAFFRRFHPQCFEDYLASALVPDPTGGVTLRIPATLEYDIFRHTPVRIGRPPEGLPITLLYPEAEGVSQPAELRALTKRLRAQTQAMPGGHMFPVERPDETAAVLRRLIEER